MADAGRDQHRIARRARVSVSPVLAAESDLGLACGDAEHFVGGRVVVVEGKDAVSPASAPAVAAEQRLEGGRRIDGAGVDRAG